MLSLPKFAHEWFLVTRVGRVGSWVELVDGPPFAGPVVLIWREDLQGFRPWAGAQNDILMEDWELA